MSGKGNTNDIEKGIVTNNDIADTSGKGQENGHQQCTDDEHNYNSLRYRFWVQVGVTSAVSAFCITMMATNSDKEGIYLPVLTGIMGYWLPSPDSRVKRPRN
jgi:hypothetical protein